MENTIVERLLGLGIGHSFITQEQMNGVLEIMGVSRNSTEKELRNARSTIVLSVSPYSNKYLEGGDYRNWEKYSATLSGATAAIDNVLWNKGYEV